MTFEKEFPELKGKRIDVPDCHKCSEGQAFLSEVIQKYCLSKQKVREAIERVVVEYQEIDNLPFEDENRVEWTPIHWFQRLKEELGL